MSRRIPDSSIPDCDGCCSDCFVTLDCSTSECPRRLGLTTDDEIPEMSLEWRMREAGFNDFANNHHGPTWYRQCGTKTGYSLSRILNMIMTKEEERAW